LEARISSSLDTNQDSQAKEGAHDDSEISTKDPEKVESTRPSEDSIRHSADAVQLPDPPAAPPRRASFLESELSRANQEHTAEVHEHLERIDALHAKIAYLSSQLHSNATAATSSHEKGSQDQKSAEQDAKIAQLLQEGEKLSRNEMKHLAAIKKLRLRVQEEERSSTEVKKRLEKIEAENRDLKDRAERAEEREKAAADRLLRLAKVEKEAETLKSDKENASREIQELKRSRDEAERRAEDAENRAQTNKVEEQMRVVAELNDELSNVRIEKRLIEDRVKSEMKEIKDEQHRQLAKARLGEVELRTEVQVCLMSTEWLNFSLTYLPEPRSKTRNAPLQIRRSVCE
jgi:chromosome segregation ATPase